MNAVICIYGLGLAILLNVHNTGKYGNTYNGRATEKLLIYFVERSNCAVFEIIIIIHRVFQM